MNTKNSKSKEKKPQKKTKTIDKNTPKFFVIGNKVFRFEPQKTLLALWAVRA